MYSANRPRCISILEIAASHDLLVVEDACEAIGAEHKGRRVGSHGHPAVFAFYPNKQMTTGEGGIVVTDDPSYAAVLRSLANQGRDDAGTWMNHVRLGYNYRLDEMSAALGLSQVRRLDEILARRARVAACMRRGSRQSTASSAPVITSETTRMSWFVYVVRLLEAVNRTALMAALREDGIPPAPTSYRSTSSRSTARDSAIVPATSRLPSELQRRHSRCRSSRT